MEDLPSREKQQSSNTMYHQLRVYGEYVFFAVSHAYVQLDLQSRLAWLLEMQVCCNVPKDRLLPTGLHGQHIAGSWCKPCYGGCACKA